MFDKYINEIKERSFVTAFLVLSVIACVAYSYHFFPILAIDDEFYQSEIFPYMSTHYWSQAMHERIRFPGLFLGTILSDGTMSKNMSLFVTLVSSSFLVILFMRMGLKIQSIFWSILLSIPIIINASIQVHYLFVTAVLRFTGTFFVLALFCSVLIEKKLKNIVVVSLLLFLCLGVYEITIVHYIVGTVLLVIKQFIDQQKQPFKQSVIKIWQNKILPSILALLLAVVWRMIMMHSLMHGTDFKSQLIVDLLKKRFANLPELGQKLHLLLSNLMYIYYPATVHNGHLVFGLLSLTTLFACFWLFRKQNTVLKKISYPLLIIVLLSVVLVITNALLSAQFNLRIFVVDGLFIAIGLYLSYLALHKIKGWSKINTVLSFIFALQLCNHSVSLGYDHYQENQAHKFTINRLFDDVLTFARNHNIKTKPTVYFMKDDWDEVFNKAVSEKGKGVFFSYTYSNRSTTFAAVEYYMKNLGALDYIKIPKNTPENRVKVKKVCKTLAEDKNIPLWPLADSIQLIDDIIYVKLTSNVSWWCGWLFDKQKKYMWKVTDYTKIQLRDAHYDLTK